MRASMTRPPATEAVFAVREQQLFTAAPPLFLTSWVP
jgi:hypothetical protein